MVEKQDLKETYTLAVDLAWTRVVESVEMEDMDGAHKAFGDMLRALADYEEALWAYANRPIEVGR